jgi:lysophospholipase L1-like esterase
VSVFLATAAMIPSQTHNVAPGTVTVAIATSGVTTGFATSTAAIPSQTGVACVADPVVSTVPQNYEMANYSVVDATHLQMTLNKPHRAGTTIAFGGLCGYGLEQTVDTTGNIRQVFPVIGSYSTSGLYYYGAITSIIGVQGNTSAFLNVSLPIASIARSNGVVTVTTSGNLPVDLNGLTVTMAGVADQSYNGSFVVTTTGSNTLTYPDAGANSTSTGGTVSKLTGGYVLYPMAEVLGVFDTATQSIDGQLTLAPNTVAWAANDPVEEPHYYQQKLAGDVTFIGQTTPRPTVSQSAGVQYQSNVGPGLTGWSVSNAVPASNYLGNGGTHAVPYAAYTSLGLWQYTMDVHAGEQAAFRVRCNSHGCGKWNSGYDLFELDGQTTEDRISYQPQTSTLGFSIGGASYQFNGQGFTASTISASTINATTVNATTINGTISAATLPLFGASGSAHAPGAVPDPGITSGTTRYLREDGTWTVPTGSGGSQPGALSNGSQPVTGALADYDFLQGSGSVLTDLSGSGNNASFGAGAAAPSWTATGLSFTGQQQVSLPATLNGARTFFAAVYFNPLTTGMLPSNQYPVLVSSSMGASGLNLLYAQEQGNNIVSGANSYAPTIWNGNVRTGVENVMSGFHVLAYVLGTGSGSVDHIYIDGVEAAAYDRQASSAGIQTSGNLFLGSSNVAPFTVSGLSGTLYRFVAMAVNTLSAQQIAAISGSIRAEIANRGVAVAPPPVTQTTPTIYAIGDSITCGFSNGGCPLTPWPSLLNLTNQPTYTVFNYGIPSVFIKAILGSEPNRVAPRCSSTAGPVNAIVFAGTNDLSFGTTGNTPVSVMGSLAGEVQVLKGAGCRVFLGTMISRLGSGVSGTTMDAAKDAYDALILANAKSVGADGVVDFAANPLLGADGAYASSAFQSDQTHPTQAGQQLLANAASNALNYYYGYNEVNPHTVTSLPYSMTAGDGAISLAGVTGAGTLTLPDCTGQSGAMYRINNPQSTFGVSVTSLNGSQLINGLSTVTVPANGTLTLRDVPNAKTVSGCHWEM